MKLSISEGISGMDRAKLRAEVLLPLARALRGEIGEARTREVLRGALEEAAREQIGAEIDQLEGTPREKFEAVMRRSGEVNGPQLELEMLEVGPEIMRFNVTGCRYAELFKELGETEIGAMLLCDSDFYVAEAFASEVEFSRSQTIMQGATHCDFCYRIRHSG
jgi:hypothetical protein